MWLLGNLKLYRQQAFVAWHYISVTSCIFFGEHFLLKLLTMDGPHQAITPSMI